MEECPQCGSVRISRSETRWPVERVRKLFTAHRPYRCRACGWRGWGEVTREPTVVQEAAPVASKNPDVDLRELDRE